MVILNRIKNQEDNVFIKCVYLIWFSLLKYCVFMKSLRRIEVSSFVRYVRISPFKVRRILDQVRGRSCNEALLILKFMPHRSCSIISKAILSAVANAKSNFGLINENFVIVEARVDAGPVLKRFCPHAQGRGFPIKKRMSHIAS